MANDYIRREDASNWLKQYGQDVLHGKYKFSLMYIWKNIMDLPSADVVQVRHGRWENYSPITIKCSRCGHVIHDWRYSECKYCPNCGAKMDGDREE